MTRKAKLALLTALLFCGCAGSNPVAQEQTGAFNEAAALEQYGELLATCDEGVPDLFTTTEDRAARLARAYQARERAMKRS